MNINQQEQELVSTPEEFGANLSEVCLSTLPVWAAQIESSRKITDESIQDLSQRFYSLSQRIQSTVTASTQSDNGGGLVGLLQESQSQLTSIIGLLKTAMDEKAVLVKAILELSGSAKDLMDMANVVSLIARETNMVAINAAIEAAHVGEKGRGFAVVADSVRLLSANAAKTGKQISERVMSVTKAINATAQISKEFEEKDQAMVQETEQIIAQVIEQFANAAKGLVDSSEQLRTEGQYVSGEISNVLVSLQFQDRVTQMLSHVQNDLYKLQSVLAEGGLQVDAATWLQELAATYTMQEQHEIQAEVTGVPLSNTSNKKAAKRGSAESKQAVSNDSNDEITFF